jgi:hypothetical protein
MAWSTSKIFTSFVTDVMNRTADAIDLDLDVHKVALFNNTGTPDQTVAATSARYNAGAWVTANEVTDSSGWPAGGRSLASVTSTFSVATYTFDAADTASANSTTTLTNVFGCLVYDDTSAASGQADRGLSFNYFGGSNSISSGLFTVVWNSSGIFNLVL